MNTVFLSISFSGRRVPTAHTVSSPHSQRCWQSRGEEHKAKLHYVIKYNCHICTPEAPNSTCTADRFELTRATRRLSYNPAGAEFAFLSKPHHKYQWIRNKNRASLRRFSLVMSLKGLVSLTQIKLIPRRVQYGES